MMQKTNPEHNLICAINDENILDIKLILFYFIFTTKTNISVQIKIIKLQRENISKLVRKKSNKN